MLFQHNPLSRPRDLECVERDRDVDDTRRAHREQDVECGGPRLGTGGTAYALDPNQVTDRVVAGSAQTKLPCGFSDHTPCRGDRRVVPVERDDECVDSGILP